MAEGDLIRTGIADLDDILHGEILKDNVLLVEGRTHIFVEASRLAELRGADERLRKANEELERRVAERTSALEKAQQKALQAERMAAIGVVAAGLAHESRNALQRSQACIEMLTREITDRPEALRLIGLLQEAQDHLLRLYEGVRDYSAPFKLERERSDLGSILAEAWRHLEADRTGRNVRLNVHAGAADLYGEFDRQLLGQVFRNILENALQSCTDPVEIDVSWSEVELGGKPGLRVALHNNGPPLTDEQSRRIFEAFFTTKTHGTGLGMAIARRIVEAHGGQIAVAQDLATGVEIVITLPRNRTINGVARPATAT